MNPGDIRKAIWENIPKKYSCLKNLAADIARGDDPHRRSCSDALSQLANKYCHVCPGQLCPKPINFLANGVDPSKGHQGLAGLLKSNIEGSMRCLSKSPNTLVFNGCNFINLEPLAYAKRGIAPTTDEQLRGFNSQIPAGLSVLFGPWSDFCLYCWSLHQPRREPMLILCRDNSPFAEERAISGVDWGEGQINEILSGKAIDPSSRNLFGAIKKKANGVNWIQYIGENGIFIYNIWPWFRCGQKPSGDVGIHSNFSIVPCIWHWLGELIDCLQSEKIAVLGGWSKPLASPDADVWLRNQSPALGKIPKQKIKVFSHPGIWHRKNGKKGCEEFKDFLPEPFTSPPETLEYPVDE